MAAIRPKVTETSSVDERGQAVRVHEGRIDRTRRARSRGKGLGSVGHRRREPAVSRRSGSCSRIPARV